MSKAKEAARKSIEPGIDLNDNLAYILEAQFHKGARWLLEEAKKEGRLCVMEDTGEKVWYCNINKLEDLIK